MVDNCIICGKPLSRAVVDALYTVVVCPDAETYKKIQALRKLGWSIPVCVEHSK